MADGYHYNRIGDGRRSARWARAAALTALAVAGQAAALHLIVAPRYAIYQHYADWGDLPARSLAALMVLGAQAAVCLALVWRSRLAVAGAVRTLLPGWRLPALLILAAFSAAVPTQSLARFGREVILAVVTSGLAALTLAFAVVAIPVDAGARAWGRLATDPSTASGTPIGRWHRALPWLLAG